MPLDTARYHSWRGDLLPPAWAIGAIVRAALIQLLRRKGYWLVLGLGLLRFLLFFAMIYLVTQASGIVGSQVRRFAFEALRFSSSADEMGDSGYLRFMDGQGVVVMILLAFAGSLLVGADFRLGALPFYLSRRIDRWHYIVGKLLAVSAVVWLVTVLPALCLFVEYGMFTSSFDYWLENGDVVLGILGYGVVMATALSIMLTTVAAYLVRTAPIAIVWSSLFVMLGGMSELLASSTGEKTWNLLNPWRNIRYVGRLWFASFRDSADAWQGWWALGIMTIVCGLLLTLLFRRVQAVDVTT